MVTRAVTRAETGEMRALGAPVCLPARTLALAMKRLGALGQRSPGVQLPAAKSGDRVGQRRIS